MKKWFRISVYSLVKQNEMKILAFVNSSAVSAS